MRYRSTPSLKVIFVLLLFLISACNLFAQNRKEADTTIKIDEPVIITDQKPREFIEMAADFPGGLQRFYQYIGSSLKFREVERLIGVSGKVKISFVVGTDGHLGSIVALSKIGAGCEEEVVNLIAHSPYWKPARQNGTIVPQKMTIPVTINYPKDTVRMVELKQAVDGYLFNIKDTIYDIDKATVILGEKFPASMVEITTLYTEPKKFKLKNKPEIYLVKIKQ